MISLRTQSLNEQNFIVQNTTLNFRNDYAIGGRAATAIYANFQDVNINNISDIDAYKIRHSTPKDLDFSYFTIENKFIPIQVIKEVPAGQYLKHVSCLNDYLNLNARSNLARIIKSYQSFTAETILESYDLNATGVMYNVYSCYINNDFKMFMNNKIIGFTKKQKEWFEAWFLLVPHFKSFNKFEEEQFIKLTIYLKISLLRLYKYITKPVIKAEQLDNQTHALIISYLEKVINNNFLRIGKDETKTDSNLKFGYTNTISPTIISFFDQSFEQYLPLSK